MIRSSSIFFNDTATTEIYTLSLHDALPILGSFCGDGDRSPFGAAHHGAGHVEQRRDAALTGEREAALGDREAAREDRKSTRLNSSHANISYAVFCLKKKKTHKLHSHYTHIY